MPGHSLQEFLNLGVDWHSSHKIYIVIHITVFLWCQFYRELNSGNIMTYVHNGRCHSLINNYC